MKKLYTMNAAMSFKFVLNGKDKKSTNNKIGGETNTDKLKRNVADWFLTGKHLRTMEDCKPGWYWDDNGIWVRLNDKQQNIIEQEYEKYNSKSLISRDKSLYCLGGKNAIIDFKNMKAMSYDNGELFKVKRWEN